MGLCSEITQNLQNCIVRYNFSIPNATDIAQQYFDHDQLEMMLKSVNLLLELTGDTGMSQHSTINFD